MTAVGRLAAIAIDPSSFIAQQEAKRTRRMLQDAQSAPAKTSRNPEGVSNRLSEAAGPVDLAPISNQPITLKLRMIENIPEAGTIRQQGRQGTTVRRIIEISCNRDKFHPLRPAQIVYFTDSLGLLFSARI